MYNFFEYLPPALLAVVIFFMRITDVSLGTLRMINVVQGRKINVLILGFFEVLIWIFAVSQVIMHLKEHIFLSVAYAAGFAVGNAVGIHLEKVFSKGMMVARIISRGKGAEIASSLRDKGWRATLIEGEGRDGPVELLYVISPIKSMSGCIDIAEEVDPDIFFITERVMDHNRPHRLYPIDSSWKSVFKKK
ncbi:MAG: DUF5698 domain-containing protein [Candidatus Altiarchaeota archaeon]